jgi:hypothetical protein
VNPLLRSIFLIREIQGSRDAIPVENQFESPEGLDNSNGILNSSELYDPAAGTWTLSATMNVDRLCLYPILLSDSRVLFPGGSEPGGFFNILSSAELFVATSTTSPPIVLTDPTILPNGSFRFSLTNLPARSFTVLRSANITLNPNNWTCSAAPLKFRPENTSFPMPQRTR